MCFYAPAFGGRCDTVDVRHDIAWIEVLVDHASHPEKLR
jgi:hypothetical protein